MPLLAWNWDFFDGSERRQAAEDASWKFSNSALGGLKERKKRKEPTKKRLVRLGGFCQLLHCPRSIALLEDAKHARAWALFCPTKASSSASSSSGGRDGLIFLMINDMNGYITISWMVVDRRRTVLQSDDYKEKDR